MAEIVSLFLHPDTARWLARFAHRILDTEPAANHAAPTACLWFQWFFTMIHLFVKEGYTIPSRSKMRETKLVELAKAVLHEILHNRQHPLYRFIHSQRIDPNLCIPYDSSRPASDQLQPISVMCVARRGAEGEFVSHYFTHVHTEERGDWIVSGYGSCYVKVPGTVIPLDPAAWQAFAEGMAECPSVHPNAVRDFYHTYFLKDSLPVYHDDETTSNESLYGQPIENGAEREFQYVYDPEAADQPCFTLYHLPDYEAILRDTLHHVQSSLHGGKRTQKKKTKRRTAKGRSRTRKL